MQLTPAQKDAIEKLGRRRKTKVKVGTTTGISYQVFNNLRRKGLVMWADQKQTCAMLTAPGEKVWTKLHPTSKYRIN